MIVPEEASPKHSGDPHGRAERHYLTMSIEELCARPVQDHLIHNAVLFLWVTAPMLSVSGKVIEAWGSEFRT